MTRTCTPDRNIKMCPILFGFADTHDCRGRVPCDATEPGAHAPTCRGPKPLTISRGRALWDRLVSARCE